MDLLGQIPASFYTQMESKKWSDRKEALEIIEKATNVPEILNADYTELVRVLKKTVGKDSNIVVVTSAAKCLCQLAQALRTNFSPYTSCLTILFEKFKEKKPNVISVIRDATDAAFVGTNLENIHEDVITFLDNKNPQIKSEMALFLARIFSRYPAQVMNKKTLRPLINALIKTLSDMDATVRDNSAIAIGTAMKVSGEKLMMTLIADVEPIKITKIKEFCEKAEILTETINEQNNGLINDQTNGQQLNLGAQTNGIDGDDGNVEDDDDQIYEMLDAVEILSQIPATFYTQMESKKWSDRKEALEIVEKATNVPKILNIDYSELVRVLKKTVGKDSNIVVVTSAAKCLCQLAQALRTNFSPYTSCLTILFEKFKEKKPNVISVIRDATDAAFVGTNLENIHEEVVQFLDNKNPQIKSEMALFLSRTFSKYPAQVMNKKTLRPLINALIKTLSDMDATVRDNSAMAIGTAMKITGEKLMMTFIADVEPIKLPKIKEYCEKAQVKKIPKSVMNSITAQAPGHVAPPPPTSSATMVRRPAPALSKNRVGALPKIGPAKQPPNSSASSLPPPNATVKRNATIIKRSVATNKRTSGAHQAPPVAAQQHQQQQQQQQQMQPPPPPQQAPQFQAPAPQVPNNVHSTPVYTNNNNNVNNIQLTQISPQQQEQQLLIDAAITPAKPQYVARSRIHLQQLQPLQQQQENDIINSKHEYHPTNLDMIVYKLISDNDNEVINSLTEIEDTLSDDLDQTLNGHINQIIDLTCLQLIKSVDIQRMNNNNQRNSNNNQSYHKVKKVIDCLVKLFSRRQLVGIASQQSIRFLLVQIFILTQTCGNMVNQDDELIVKSLNNLAAAVMDGFEPANMMCILTGLLNDPPQTSIVEPIKTAIIRSMRSFK